MLVIFWTNLKLKRQGKGRAKVVIVEGKLSRYQTQLRVSRQQQAIDSISHLLIICFCYSVL